MDCQGKKSLCQQAIVLLGALVVVLLVSRVVSLSQRVQELESRPDYDEEEITKLVRTQIDETVKSMEARARQQTAQRQQQLAQAHQAQEQQRLAAEAAAAAAAEAAHQEAVAAAAALEQQRRTSAEEAAAAAETEPAVSSPPTEPAADEAEEASLEQGQPEVSLTPRAPRKKAGTKKRAAIKEEAEAQLLQVQ
jgi:translation initiation factor IF-2